MNTIIEQYLKEAFQNNTISCQSFLDLWNTEKYQNQIAKITKNKTCYGIFCEENYDAVSKVIEKSHEYAHNKRQSQIKKKLSEMWYELQNSTDPESMEKLHSIKNAIKKTKKVNNKTKKTKRTNPYFLFCQDHRDNIRNELPAKEGFTYQDVVKELGRRWQVLISSTEQENINILEEYRRKATQSTVDGQNSHLVS